MICRHNLIGRSAGPCCFAFLITFLTFSPVLAALSIQDKIRLEIKHAHTYYWFGIAEKGNMLSLSQGLSHLDKARVLLNTAPLPKETTKALERQIEALKADLIHQREVNFDTLYGVFPLVRLLAPSLFANAAAAGTFELIDDPPVVAVTTSGEKLLKNVLEKWTLKPQLNVVFNSVPSNRALESELLYIFNSSPNFFVHDYYELVKFLHPRLLTPFEGNRITKRVKEPLCNALGVQDILVVTVHRQDVIDNNYFYVTEARLYNVDKDVPTHSFFSMGFCRDRRYLLWPIIQTNGVLLLLSIPLYIILFRLETGDRPNILDLIFLATFAFALGRTMPWALVPLCSSVAPEPETLAKLAFWWPCMIGIVLFFAPFLLLEIVSNRLAPLSSVFRSSYGSGAAFTVAALGVCAYLAAPLFLYTGKTALLCFFPLVLSTVPCAFVLGSVFDQNKFFPHISVVASILIFVVIGVILAHVSPIILWVCVGIIWGLILVPLKFSLSHHKKLPHKEIYRHPEKTPQDVMDLISLSRSPPYIKFDFYNDILEKVEPFLDGCTCWLYLTGGVGVGKTATSNALIHDLKKAVHERGKELRLLDAQCPEKMGDLETNLTPYAPFQKAFSRELPLRRLHFRQEAEMRFLEGVIELAVPMANLILPPTADPQCLMANREGMLYSVAEGIRKLANKAPVVLFFDDVHWIDEASKELLCFLFSAFPPGSPNPLLFLLTSREPNPFEAGLQNYVTTIDMPNKSQRARILVSGLGIAQETAQDIVARVGEVHGDKGGLFWLFRMVGYFAEKGALIKAKNAKGFTWSNEYKHPNKELPIPDDFRTVLEDQVKTRGEFKSILECAACIGLEFSAGVLGKGLGMPRLKLLQILEQIEEETGILIDVRDEDDIFAFSSSFILEIIRQRMNITCKGPCDTTVPQLIREYHARVAKSLEGSLADSPDKIYEVARHYYASGEANAHKALKYCVSAAHSARSQFLFARAKEYIRMAHECAELVQSDYDLQQEEILIDCDESHVMGTHRKRTADRALAYLKKCSSPPFFVLLAVVRACYDAGVTTGHQLYFSEAIRLSNIILEKSNKPFEKAEAYHFKGICTKDVKEAETLLRIGMDLLSGVDPDDLSSQALLARISNSLAELLNNNKKDPEEVEKLFQLSLKIKERPEISDLPGLARSHGGLGRLYLCSEPPNIDKARNYFQKDLEYSEKLGDIVGQIMMHSFLGQCDLRQGRFQEALDHYKKSFSLSNNLTSRFYALSGILKAAAKLEDKENFDGAGMTLVSALIHREAASEVPIDCVCDVLKTLETCADMSSSPWVERLKALAVEKAHAK